MLRRLGGLLPAIHCWSAREIRFSLSAAGGFLLWNTGDTSSSHSGDVDSAGTFSLQFDDGQGCVVVDSLSIFIQGGPPRQPIGGSAGAVPGDSTLLRAAGGASYMWEDGSVRTACWLRLWKMTPFGYYHHGRGLCKKTAHPGDILSGGGAEYLPPAICQGILCTSFSPMPTLPTTTIGKPDINTVYSPPSTIRAVRLLYRFACGLPTTALVSTAGSRFAKGISSVTGIRQPG